MILTATTAAALTVAAPATAAPKRAEAPGTAAATAYAQALDRAYADAERYVADNQARLATTYWGCVATMQAAPKAQFMHAYHLGVWSAFAETVVRPGRTIFRRLVARLDAVRTSDPALRGVRAVWRDALEVVERSSDATDGCAQLERWKAAGWSDAAKPPLPEVDVAAVSTTEAESLRTERRVRAGVRRLRALGVAPRRATHADPEEIITLLGDAMPDPLSEAGGEDGAGATRIPVTR